MRRLLLLVLLPLALAAEEPAADPRFAPAAAVSADGGGFAHLVLLDGRVVHEEYRGAGRADRASELASGTKSFAGVLALAATEDGLLDLDEPVSDTLGEWRDDARRALTVRQLLTLTSGLPGGPIGRPPSYREAVAATPVAAPGERFAYGPAPFQVFGEVLRRKLAARDETVAGYAERRVFAPLGLRPGAWRRDADGQPHLPSGLALTARDWARFGEMVRRDGDGVLAPGKLDALFRGTAANPAYGLTWWLPAEGPIGAGWRRNVAGAGLPRDIRVAAGAGGQRLVVIPSLGLVAVRQAPVRLREGGFDERAWLAALVAGARAAAAQ
jgi:CubicO group peptidase (beta-lactamase class C family)